MYIHLGRVEPAPRRTDETPSIPVPPFTRVLNTTWQPFRYICSIHVRTMNGKNSLGTGVLISRHHVLTCAHVLYPYRDPHPKEVTVLPGQNGPDDKRPRIRANGWVVSPGWRWNDCHTADEDFGIIRLARPTDAGFWPIAPFEPSILVGADAHLAGYPSFSETDQAFWMYRSRGDITGRIQITRCSAPAPPRKGTADGMTFTNISDATKLVVHKLITAPSMSGGPMWIYREGKAALVALHAGDIEEGKQKKAVLLNTTVRNRIAEWMRRTLPPLNTGPK